MEKRIPELYMEQQLLGELSPEKALKIMNSEEALEQLGELEKSNRKVLETYPADKMAAIIRERMINEEKCKDEEGVAILHSISDPEEAPRGKNRKRNFQRYVPLLSAAALAAFILLPTVINRPSDAALFRSSDPETVDPAIRIKGLEPHLNIYRKIGGEVERLPDTSIVDNYDLLQISYISSGKKYGTIFSIDGNGVVTLHYPDFTEASPELFGEGEVLLDFSYQLDDAPGFERFFFISSDSYFSLDTIMESAAHLAGSAEQAREGILEIPTTCDIDSILLLKEGSDE